MNQLKQIAKKDGIEFFLTYADNYAIGYFKKQGFQRTVTMKRERWVGFIKDYDGGTLMECPLSEQVDYANLPKLIDKQRQAILERLRASSSSHIVHKSLAEVHRMPVDENGDVIGRELHICSAAQIPGLPVDLVLPKYRYTWQGTPSTLAEICEKMTKALVTHQDAWPFLSPVDVSEAPDYYDVIKAPVDLAMMQRRVSLGSYRVLRQFTADVRQMCKNCRAYNGEDNIYFDCAQSMDAAYDQQLMQAQEFLCTPDDE